MKRVILFLLVCLLLLGCSAKAPVEQEADNTPRIEEDTPEKEKRGCLIKKQQAEKIRSPALAQSRASAYY